MVEKIKEMKDQALKRMEQAVSERGIERVDVGEMGKLADVVKDLAEAEKSCWEAEYYRAVTESMGGGLGYDGAGGGMGYQGGYGYRRGYDSGRSGYMQPRDAQGRFTGRYGRQDMLQEVRQMMESADPQEREEMARQLRQMV